MRKLQIEVADHVYEKLVRDAGQRNFTKHISQLILNYVTEAREDTDVIASILARLHRLENLETIARIPGCPHQAFIV